MDEKQLARFGIDCARIAGLRSGHIGTQLPSAGVMVYMTRPNEDTYRISEDATATWRYAGSDCWQAISTFAALVHAAQPAPQEVSNG